MFTETHTCSVNMRLQILGQVPFFAGLSQEDLGQVNRLFHEQGYATNEAIYFTGDPAKHLWVMADGRVKLMRHSLSGKDVRLDPNRTAVGCDHRSGLAGTDCGCGYLAALKFQRGAIFTFIFIYSEKHQTLLIFILRPS
jgi:CRP-like cAMP-binding protein